MKKIVPLVFFVSLFISGATKAQLKTDLYRINSISETIFNSGNSSIKFLLNSETNLMSSSLKSLKDETFTTYLLFAPSKIVLKDRFSPNAFIPASYYYYNNLYSGPNHHINPHDSFTQVISKLGLKYAFNNIF